MAELSLEQIEHRLDDEFLNLNDYQKRKLIFWYDSNGDFKEDIKDFSLKNAKVLELTPTNQFKSKVLLEREDPNSSYLIYAPFEKPKPEENHLEDTYLYSIKFNADRVSLIMSDLNIPLENKQFLQKYNNFFRSKNRTEKFRRLGIKDYSKKTIEEGIIRSLIKSAHTFREAVRILITSSEELQEKYLNELEKYNLLETFWEHIKDEFGYISEKPDLNDFIRSLYTSTLKSDITVPVTQWDRLSYSNPNDARIFLESLRDNTNYQDNFNRISGEISSKIQIEQLLNTLEPENYYKINLVPEIDKKLISWITERLEQEDITAKVDQNSISDLIKDRLITYYGKKNEAIYRMLLSALELIELINRFSPDFNSLKEFFTVYSKKTYRIDQLYRKFYYYYDQLNDRDKFENLRQLVENLYTNLYMEPEIRRWNELLKREESYFELEQQKNFFRDKIKNKELKTAVIISDALRYEIAQELFEDLMKVPKNSGELIPLAGMLPSYTRLGMSALLPHEKLELSDNFEVFVDEKTAYDLKDREKQLQKVNNNNIVLNYNEVIQSSTQDLRKKLNGKNLIYIYHNKVDSTGDKKISENEVFRASQDAIEEIKNLVKKLNAANVNNFMITADHGFLYKRNKLEEMDKISLDSRNNLSVNKRYVISEKPLEQEGVISIPISKTFNNNDTRFLNFPLIQNVFKAPGAGINYVHGGSSPQETVLPLIKLKTGKNKIETRESGIGLFTQLGTITNLLKEVSFYQKEAVSNEVIPQEYKIYFETEDKRIISDTHIFVADSTDFENKRIKNIQFKLAQIEYDRNKIYYLTAVNEEGIEVLREPVTIDILFSGDFGFSV